MNEQTISIAYVVAITAVLSLGLGVIVWQIFRSEPENQKNNKA